VADNAGLQFSSWPVACFACGRGAQVDVVSSHTDGLVGGRCNDGERCGRGAARPRNRAVVESEMGTGEVEKECFASVPRLRRG
jgi:hypothetical protein